MLSVGITGGIGSGKSTVCRVFELLEVPVFYADDVARKLQDTDVQVREKMTALLGKEIFTNDVLNRKLVAEKVFVDKNLLSQLNQIIHPATINEFNKWKENYIDKPYILKEAAVLFESESHKGLDAIIVVTAPEELRIERIIKRDKTSKAQIIDRMKNQMAEEKKIARADYLIVNDESSAIIPQIMKIHQSILQQFIS